MMRIPGAILWGLFAAVTPGQASGNVVVDLASVDGVRLVGAEWRYADASIVALPFRSAGEDLRPSGPPNTTHDVAPHAGGADFDDSAWSVIAPDQLAARRGSGRLCFGWYRLQLTLPERIGNFEVAESTVAFELVLDDYAEIWVDGVLPRHLGQRGGNLIAVWNAQNRVVLTHRAFAGQAFSLAVFAANGPLSDPPANYLWIRSARLVFAPTRALGERRALDWQRLDPRLDRAVTQRATVEVVSSGHQWLEGPAWDRGREVLYFSDIPRNEVLQWRPFGKTERFVLPSGYTGTAPFVGREPGSNGLAVDPGGELWLCMHGDRRIARRSVDGVLHTVVDRVEGKRLNSPNDLLLAPNGDLWWTDPPFGLPGAFDDPARELAVAGVYRRSPDGRVVAVVDDLRGPNGLALSPDQRTLYVSDADPAAPKWWRFSLDEGGGVAARSVLCDAGAFAKARPGAPDGMKVDAFGHLFAAGPGGVYVFHPDGALLGVLVTGVATSNCCFGADGRVLFVTADREVLVVRW